MRPELAREIRRKLFHLLTLAYLFAFLWIGFPDVVLWMAVWTALVVAAELIRLRWPALNALVFRIFGGITRPAEAAKVSGALWTSVGALATMALFGRYRYVVAGGLVCLSVGDAAAAVVGRAFGRHKWPGSAKSLEGSAACFAACALGCLAAGLSPAQSAAAALAATAVEALPFPFDDNLWVPVVSSAAVWLCVR